MSTAVFIASYQELGKLAEEVADLKEEIEIRVARIKRTATIVRQKEKHGAELIISRGITTWEIKLDSMEDFEGLFKEVWNAENNRPQKWYSN